MKESLAKLQEQIVIKQQELQQIERELEDISQAKSSISDEIAGLEKKLAALHEERNALEQAGEMIPEELLSEIASQETALAQKQSELQMWEAKFVEAKAREEAARKELDSLETSAAFLKEQIDLVTNAKPEDLEEIGKVIAGLQEEIKKLQELLEEKGDLSAFREQLEAGEAELAAQAEAGRAQLASARQQLEEGKAAIIAAGNKLDTSKKELDTAYRTIVSGQRQINAGWKALRENEQTLKDAKASLTAGEEELAIGKSEYEDGKQKAEEKFREAEEEIAKAENEIEEIAEPEWYLMTRDSLTEYGGYGDNAERMRAIGKVFPVLFFLVAALISLTTMTRMVEEQRTQIGTLKALGYSKLEIAGKYLNYALLASVGGSIVGVLFGEKVFPFIIVYAYKIMYKHIPHIVIPYHLSYGVMATLAAVACTFLATLISCYRELASTPAVLMRPPAPKEGKRILLERITFLWKHFSFIWKSTFRNLIRYKKRFFMTIFGIGGCMALMLVGFGLKDSIYCILDLQYQEVQEYDGAVYLKENASPSGKEALVDYLDHNDEIGQTAELYMKMITVEHGKETQEPYLTVVKNKEEFEKLVHFRDRLTGETYEIQDDGVMLSEKLASMLEVKRGDTITIVNEERGNREVKVTDICENYLGHYIYMSGAYYKELYGEEAVYNCFYFDQKEYNEVELQKIGEDVLAYPDVLNISYADTMRAQMDDMLRSLNLVIVVLIISAGALAFIVLYNLNNINITERQRELATLKVLGFYDKEVGAYVYRENILLTIIGAFVGCGLGWLLHRYVIVTVEVEEVMFGRQIDFSSFVYSFLFTVGFSLIVNFVMYFKLKKIDMVESLKSVE
ncbi:ABC transporter permease [Coprococcus sp. AF21-14LB]|nr:ABC transporter permease [Coprococcus sp. AF21-14LB]